MCGIVGYIGKKDVDSVILVGLEKLEYRGYDSEGFASIVKGELFIKKKKGRISELAKILNSTSIPSNIGIGHTRWATHGKPSDENAHPHIDCKKTFAIVHNGIIENFRELKRKLEKKHNWSSDTDTEIIVHLLEENYKGDFLERVLNNIKNAVSKINDIPEEVKGPDVTEITTDEFPILQVSISGAKSYSDLRKSTKIIEDRILRIKGVARIEKTGVRDKVIYIDADRKKLNYYFSQSFKLISK